MQQVNSHLSRLVHDVAAKLGNREALIYKDFGSSEWKSYTWNEFSQKVKLVSNALLNMGVGVQENIGVFSQNTVQYLFTDFGAWGIRAVTIPFYATSSEQQIQFMINDAQIRFVFVGEQAQYDKARRVFATCRSLERIIVFDPAVSIAEGDTTAIHFDDFLRLGEGLPRQSEVENLWKAASMDDTANILYTSGTTGDSKGVLLTCGQYHAAFEANHKCVPVTDQDRVLNFLPFTHIFEKGWKILCITVGARLIVNTNPMEVQQSMREQHPTCMSAVPRFWEKVYHGVLEKIESSSAVKRKLFEHALKVGRRHNIEYVSKGMRPPLTLHLEYEMLDKTVFSLVRHELGLENAHFFPTAGAAIPREVEEFVHSCGINMTAGYGLTETTATVSCDWHDSPVSIGSVGRVLAGIEISFGENNEILLKGDTITKGYYRKAEMTAQAIDKDGWFHTGDSGYIKNGELFLTDRIKDLFKTSNGKYISPQALESKFVVDRYIDEIAIIADERKFVSALVIPDYSLLEKWASDNAIAFESREQLCANPLVVKMMLDRISMLQQEFAQYEQVKRITLLPEPFSMEKGELTNTLKMRRPVIAKNYKELIDAMYED